MPVRGQAVGGLALRRLGFLGAFAALLLAVGCAAPVASQRPAAEAPYVSVAATPAATLSQPGSSTASIEATSPSASRDPRLYPDPVLTPGETLTVTAEQVSVPGYSSKVRDVSTTMKRQVYTEYGLSYPQKTGSYECDHFIPLCLGGSNAIENLWAEPSPEFRWKDGLEVYLWREVRARKISLGEAQREIQVDWYAYWVTYGRPGLTAQSDSVSEAVPIPQADIGTSLVVGWSVNGKRYHYDWCRYCLAIKAGNLRTGSVAAAKKAGKTPCLVCMPPAE